MVGLPSKSEKSAYNNVYGVACSAVLSYYCTLYVLLYEYCNLVPVKPQGHYTWNLQFVLLLCHHPMRFVIVIGSYAK